MDEGRSRHGMTLVEMDKVQNHCDRSSSIHVSDLSDHDYNDDDEDSSASGSGSGYTSEQSEDYR